MKSGERKNTETEFDLRVRERNLQKGVLESKTVERYLAELRDVEANCEPAGLAQPAMLATDEGDDE